MKNVKKLHVFCAVLLMAALLAACIPAQADGGTGNLYMYVCTGNTGRLHLRALPTTESQSLGLYANGTQVLVESISNNWAFVTVNGRRGYMLLSCLTGVAPSVPVPVSPAVTPVPTEDTTLYVRTGNSGRLHLREFASQSARSLGLYANGTAVRVTARSGAWAFVNINGATGYMMLQFLTATAPSQPVNPYPIQPGEATLMYVRTGNSGKLHLREYPSLSARSLGLYPNGTQVYALSMNNGWSQAVVSGQSGYMMSQYLAPYSVTPDVTPVPVPEGSTVMYIYTGNTGRLHLRENMSTESRSLGLYANGTQVAVITNYGNWAYVNVGGRVGYMMTRYLISGQPGPVVTPVPISPVPTALPGQATVQQPNNSFVYLRSTKNSESISNVICQVPSGSVVTVVEWGGPWSKIRYDGMEGYMVTNYLK